jgi:glycosyltransferase involved in cell wall biosynthesis
MEIDPPITVIIPVYNQPSSILERAIASLREQTYRNYTTLIIDDGSSDPISIETERDSNIHILRLPENQGAAAARNYGVSLATTELIAFLDADDQWLPYHLKAQLFSFRLHPEAKLVYSDYCAHYPNPKYPARRISLVPKTNPLLQLLGGNFIHSLSQVMVRRAALQSIGGFDPGLRSCHDWDLYFRLFTNRADIAHQPIVSVNKYWLPGSLTTASQERWLTNGTTVLSKFFASSKGQIYSKYREQALENLKQSIKASQSLFSEVS